MEIPDGLHTHRLKPEAGNPREVAMANEWKEAHKYSDLLAQLIVVPCHKDDEGAYPTFGWGHYKAPLGEVTERDRIVAATVFQWLGSNIGLGHVQQALEKCRYSLRWPTVTYEEIP